MRIISMLKLAVALAPVAVAMPVIAGPTNLGFESGDLSGWTLSGTGSGNASPAPWLAADGISPTFDPYGAFYGYAVAGEDETYTTLSQTFSLTAGSRLSFVAGFANQDGDGYFPDLDAFYSDVGYVAINGYKLIEWNGKDVGARANTGWVPFQYLAGATGDYTLEIGVANGGDGQVPSAVLLDNVALTGPVPETATWAMMVLGFGAAGAALRSRRRTVSFG